MIKEKILILLIMPVVLVGCSVKSEFMLQKTKQKKMNLSPDSIESPRYTKDLVLEPVDMTLAKDGIEIYIKHLNKSDLENFFNDEERFGDLADSNPYFADFIVFYVKISNNSGSAIKLMPKRFVLLDNLHNQYDFLDADYIISLYKARSSVYSFTRSSNNVAPGGIYGASVEMATSLAGRGMTKKSIQLKTVELSSGYVYDNVVYDGLIVFFKPSVKASTIKVVLPDIKTRFGLNDEVLKKIKFEADFKIVSSKSDE